MTDHAVWFHVFLLARPDAATLGAACLVNGVRLTPLNVPDIVDVLYPVSFETAFERLGACERMFIELDGSFVWRTDAGQLDGVLVDRAGRLAHIECKGSGTLEMLDQVLHCCDLPPPRRMYQFARQDLCLADADWRRWFAAQKAADG